MKTLRELFNIRSIYARLVLFFLLVIIPIYASSLIINDNAKRNVKEEISESMSSRVHYYVGSLEQEWDKITTFKQHFLIDRDIKQLSELPYLSEYERLRTINSLEDKLVLMEEANALIESANIFLPHHQLRISKSGYTVGLTEQEIDALKASPLGGATPFYWQEKLYLTEYYPLPGQGGELPSFALEVKMSEDRIRDTLRRVIAEGDGEVMLVDRALQWNITDGRGRVSDVPILDWLRDMNTEQRGQGQRTTELDGSRYLLTYEFSPNLGMTLVVAVPEERILGPLNLYRNWTWALSALALIVVLLFSWQIYRTIHMPLKRLVRAFRKVEEGDLSVSIRHAHGDEFQYLYGQFNRMVSQVNILIREVYEQKIRSQRAEVKQLQSQINPHFLYNSFFTISHLVMAKDYDTISTMTRHLGEYFRFLTRNSADEVSLEKEAQHAKAYAEIQQIRFSNRLSLTWEDIPAELQALKVPRLVLQPLVENAVIHAIERKTEAGMLAFSLEARSHGVLLIVDDNGEDATDEKIREMNELLNRPAQETTGIVNVHQRIRIRYGPGSGLHYCRNQWGGIRAELTLRWREDKEAEHETADRR